MTCTNHLTHLSRRRLPRTAAVLLEALESRLLLSTLPAGFSETRVTNLGLTNPTAMDFSPTGELWVLEQTGAAKLIRNDGSDHTARTLTVDSRGERGLLGIAFDPTYDGAGPNSDFVYLYYTRPRQNSTTPANNRISRFAVSGAGTATPSLINETLILELPPENEDNDLGTGGDTNHNGGAIHFGQDGKLYVAVGDHNYDTTPQSADVSQILTSPFGKLLRINPDGSNPTDNPFYDGIPTSIRGSIWSLGLRNPYTFAIQPASSLLYINDVGESAWEEINRGEAGANYGWAGSTSPLWEGFEPSPPPWANYRDPIMAFDHSSTSGAPAGCAITGGAFYPTGSQFGSIYAGKYLFADFCGNFIRTFDPANPGTASNPDTSAAFASGLTFDSPVDLKVDAAGSLYYLSRGGGGGIFKIQFNAPTITSQPTNTTVNAGQAATFTVAATGAGTLSYEWQKLTGNVWSTLSNGGRISGATSTTLMISMVDVSDAGSYRAVVRNSNGAITASNTAIGAVEFKPIVGDLNQDGHLDGDDYFLMDLGFALQLSGPENGDLDGNGTIDADDYSLIDIAFATQGQPLATGVPTPVVEQIRTETTTVLKRTRHRHYRHLARSGFAGRA